MSVSDSMATSWTWTAIAKIDGMPLGLTTPDEYSYRERSKNVTSCQFLSTPARLS